MLLIRSENLVPWRTFPLRSKGSSNLPPACSADEHSRPAKSRWGTISSSDATGSVLTSLVLALADPQPRDSTVTSELPRYKELDPRWHNWSAVREACADLALRLSGAIG